MKYEISVQEFIHRSEAGGIDYNDFIAAFREELSRWKKYDFLRIESGMKCNPKESLYGLPVSVKDCICTNGLESCAGSRVLQGYVPPFDATVIKRSREEGGNIIGKTNQDEFGFGTFSVNSAYGIPKNPHDPERACGGSSGGSGGLTAALKFPHISLAESTGGSISAPAAFCGVVGITPTYGLVSRYGLIDYANSLDKIGPIAKNVWDAALMLSVIAGHDEMDMTSLHEEKKNYLKHCSEDVKGMTVGIPKEYFQNIDGEVEKNIWDAIKKLEADGITYKEVSLPHTKYALAAYYIIATSEASTNLARYCGMRYGLHKKLEGNFNEYFSGVRTDGFGDEAKRRIILGTFARMSGYRDQYYLKAMRIRTLVIEDFRNVLKGVDALAAPAMPVLPPKFSEIEKLTPLQNYQMDVLTVPANLAGVPMISVPCRNKFVGLHIIGGHLQEGNIIKIAGAYETIR
ncbi:MAG: amidase family protein [Candidatus Aenigmarchaeota archaeon]|nr:amidase family protein [Candidatus Aenigmarchaeota archaeon]MDI6722842.1 amidase family protein [Candidatus Aenigmarchaeota archaeon]